MKRQRINSLAENAFLSHPFKVPVQSIASQTKAVKRLVCTCDTLSVLNRGVYGIPTTRESVGSNRGPPCDLITVSKCVQ